VKKVLLLCIIVGTLRGQLMPWTGEIDVGPWWVQDNNSLYQSLHQYRGVCVINDSEAWVVGDSGQVWKRTGGVHSHSWTEITNLPTGYGNYHFNDVFFIDTNTGWIVGEYKHDSTTHDTLKYRGVIYKTIDGSDNWSNQTPVLSYDPYPTPFLKVHFVDGDVGYITCGNGRVIRTINGGTNWYETSSDPWDHINNTSVWYGGLHAVNSTNLWVSGDAYGIMAKSTNGGNTWTSYQPDVFRQSYSFPGGTTTPYDPRLANFDAQFSSMNNGVIALSYGLIGTTANGGTSWDTTRYEPQPTWFYDVTYVQGDTCLSVGNYGVVHRCNGDDIQENVSHYMHKDPHVWNFSTIDEVANSSIAYAAGTRESGKLTIAQRYLPTDFTLDSTWVNYWKEDPYHYYEIGIQWYTTFERNTDHWWIGKDQHNYLMYKKITDEDNISAAGYSDTLIEYTFLDTLMGNPSSGSYKDDYYYQIVLRTNDLMVYPGTYYEHCYAVIEFDTTLFDSLATILHPPPPPPEDFSAEDVPNDEGGEIRLTWSLADNAYEYHIGRAVDSLGPYCYIKHIMSSTCVTYTDTTVQNNRSYFYVVSTRGPNSSTTYSCYSDVASAQALDNIAPPEPTNLAGSYLQANDIIRLQWQPPSNTPDVAGYWVCPIPPGESDHNLNHASPIDRTIFYLPVDSTWQGPCEFFVAAMDHSGNVDVWSDPCTVYVAATIDTSSSDKATAYTNGRNMVRTGNSRFWVGYESDGVVYVKKSTDDGKTWSGRMQLGSGYNPCISANTFGDDENPPPCVVWWAQGSNDTLYFSKYVSGTSWSTPAALVTSSNDFGPPSIVVGSDDYCYLAYQDGSTINYVRFDIDRPQPGTPDSVGQGDDPSIHYMTPGSGYPEVHVTWEKNDSLYYRAKKLSTGWNSSEIVLSNGQQPSLEVVGSVVHIVCEGAGNDIWHCKTTYTPLGHLWSSAKLYDTNDPSKYPVITGGSACAWMEELRDGNEIYHSYYVTEGGWSTPENLSMTSNHSNYPHITHRQTESETKVFFVWTENNSSPYNIIFFFDTLDGGERDDNGLDLPYYVAECGEETPCGFNVHRDGYIQYGREPWRRIDYDADYLEYRFEKLNRNRDYALAAYLYHGYNDPIPLTVKIDNVQIAAVNLNAHELVNHKVMLPASMTADGQVTVKIYGDDAVSAILALYEYEVETDRGMSGPQSLDSPQLSGKLMLQMPNPITKRTLISYELPLVTEATLKIYNITGALRREINLTQAKTGSVMWDGRDNIGRTLATGIYFCRLEACGKNITEKVVFLR